MFNSDFDNEPRAESIDWNKRSVTLRTFVGGGNMVFVSETGDAVLTIEPSGKISLNPNIEQDVAVATVVKIASNLLQGKF